MAVVHRAHHTPVFPEHLCCVKGKTEGWNMEVSYLESKAFKELKKKNPNLDIMESFDSNILILLL